MLGVYARREEVGQATSLTSFGNEKKRSLLFEGSFSIFEIFAGYAIVAGAEISPVSPLHVFAFDQEHS